MAGYSGTPLVKKLGIKSGQRVLFVGAPRDFAATLGELPDDVHFAARANEPLDFALLFTNKTDELRGEFASLMSRVKSAGMIWVAWHKKASKRPTELDENIVRDIGLELGWVDVKVAVIDEVWSGLKFVRRLKDR